MLILRVGSLVRLGLHDRISLRIPISHMLPAVGQGAIAIETRSDDDFAPETTRKLDHRETRLASGGARVSARSRWRLSVTNRRTRNHRTGLLKLDGLVARRMAQSDYNGITYLAPSRNCRLGRHSVAASTIDRTRRKQPIAMTKPLEGRTVVVTRAAAQADELSTSLKAMAPRLSFVQPSKSVNSKTTTASTKHLIISTATTGSYSPAPTASSFSSNVS